MQTCRRRQTLIVLEGNRRNGDRRRHAAQLRYPERRHGFDRRTAHSSLAVVRFLDTGVRVLAREPWRLAVLLAMVLGLAWLDLRFTVDALAGGAREANPIMAMLLSADVRVAAAVKLGVTLSVVGGIWLLRGYRRVIEAALLILGMMLALIAYHIVLQAAMA